MSGNVGKLVRSVELDRDANIVIIELHCSDALAAVVLLEDISEKMTSGDGLQLSLRGKLVAEGSGS